MRHSTAKGCIKNKSRSNEEKENTGIRFSEPAKKLGIRQTMTNSSCCCSNNSSIATQSSSSGGGSSNQYAYKTDFSIAQTTPQSSSYTFLHWNKNREYHTQGHHAEFEPWTPRSERQQHTCYPTLFIVYNVDRDWYISILRSTYG